MVAGNTIRPTPLDILPQSEVHVQTGYVAEELCESVKIIYEFSVRHGNCPVTVRGVYTLSRTMGLLAMELTAEAVVAWAATICGRTQNRDKEKYNAERRKAIRLTMVTRAGKVFHTRCSQAGRRKWKERHFHRRKRQNRVNQSTKL